MQLAERAVMVARQLGDQAALARALEIVGFALDELGDSNGALTCSWRRWTSREAQVTTGALELRVVSVPVESGPRRRPAGCLELEAFVGLELERICQAQHGVHVRLAQSSLQVLNRARTEACPLGEGRLRHTCLEAKLSQPDRERTNAKTR
jgi:hypothetical protein